VRTFCESLFQSSRAIDAKIKTVKRYGDLTGVHHRFLIFHIVRSDGEDFYMRMDRRRDRSVPLRVFGMRGLTTPHAIDTVYTWPSDTYERVTDFQLLTGCHIWST